MTVQLLLNEFAGFDETFGEVYEQVLHDGCKLYSGPLSYINSISQLYMIFYVGIRIYMYDIWIHVYNSDSNYSYCNQVALMKYLSTIASYENSKVHIWNLICYI